VPREDKCRVVRQDGTLEEIRREGCSVNVGAVPRWIRGRQLKRIRSLEEEAILGASVGIVHRDAKAEHPRRLIVALWKRMLASVDSVELGARHYMVSDSELDARGTGECVDGRLQVLRRGHPGHPRSAPYGSADPCGVRSSRRREQF